MTGTTEGMRYVLGDLLDADVEALVNTVNTVGVMGKGVALQFKRAYPENFKAYKRACDRQELRPGDVFVWRRVGLNNPRYILNVATKKHWRGDSKMEYVERGLENLRKTIDELGIRSIALPPLGAGSGGLPWSDVKRQMESALRGLSNVTILIYTPRNEAPQETKVATKKPAMTPFRAFVVAAIEAYREPTYRLGRLELQKLAYFLQRAGAPLNLEFEAEQFGPYSDALTHAIDAMEGHYIRGFGDRTGASAVYVLPGAMQEARAVLLNQPGSSEVLAKLDSVVRGFESPYGLELLASVDWVMDRNGKASSPVSEIIEAVKRWDERKASLFAPDRIRLAAKHLRATGLEPQQAEG
jgi:O-acetyl-ADP-ribose deacetylase (regulator of RNase III)